MFAYILDDHNQEGQLNAESLVGISRAGDIVCRDVSAHDLKDRALDVGVSYSLDVTVSHTLVPNLEWLRPKAVLILGSYIPDGVQNGQET